MSKQTSYYSTILGLLSFILLPAYGQAQGFSYDGNRWYEIEVTIFTNQLLNFDDRELFVPERARLSYPANIRELTPASSAYYFEFERPLDGPAADPLIVQPFSFTNNQNNVTGPENLRRNSEFRLPDFSRDAFIELGARQAQFQNINRALESSREHRILYQAVWRQPVFNRVQAPAIFIRGGDSFGQHSELEGSLTMSFNVNRVVVDAVLWRNTFTPQPGNSPWNIPTPPFAPATRSDLNYSIDEVYYMNQSRAMISNELHYIDHPALGILIEVRPYTLPLPESDVFSFD